MAVTGAKPANPCTNASGLKSDRRLNYQKLRRMPQSVHRVARKGRDGRNMVKGEISVRADAIAMSSRISNGWRHVHAQ